MRKLLLTILLVFAATAAGRAADGDLFKYPVPPPGLDRLDERCDYLVSQFWRSCDFKSAMSKMDALNSTFGDWVSFMPYASADTVHAAIDRLLQTVAKSGPQTLALAHMAEGWVYSDSADIFSEEIYYPFAAAAAKHRKISAADRARFEHQVQQLDNSQVGRTAGHLDYERVDGSMGTLDSARTQMVILFFHDHDCDACIVARGRLNADINATALIRKGLLTVMCIEPADATDEWRAAAERFPAEWTVGAAADADQWYTMRHRPQIYLLDSRHRVLAKDIQIDGLLNALRTMRQQSGI